MKRFNFNNKSMIESPYPPQDTNVLWVDVDESTGKVSSISKFNNGTWKIILLKLTGDMYKIYVVRKKDISNCTYNMVDLGLPSGLKWADRNVGAASPEDYGSYFQWGDVEGFTYDGKGEITAAEMASLLQSLVGNEMEITVDNVGMILEQMGVTGTDLTPTGMIFSIDKEFNWDSYNEVDKITSWEEDNEGYRYPTSFKKYNYSESGLTVLDSSDDAATVHMGPQYRMPTYAEIRELIDSTTQTFIDVDGNEYDRQYIYDNRPIELGKLKGVRFTGSNRNSIFIPAVARCFDALLTSIGHYGSLLSSSLDGYGESAISLYFNYDGGVTDSSSYRYYGQSVRGVQA